MDRPLLRGGVYFSLLFDDDELSIPIIQTLVFIEEREGENGLRRYIFKNICADGESKLLWMDDDGLSELLLDKGELLRKLSISTSS